MANEMLEIVSPQVKKDLNDLISGLDAIAGKINKINSSPVNLPSDARNLNNAGASVSNAIVKQREASIKAIERERLAEIRLQQQRERAFDSYDKKLQRETQKLAQSESLYSKIQQKLNALNLEYRDLAAKKQLDINLTDAEAKRYTFLEARIKKYDGALKAVDASMGRYTRNVGNYASGFSPLSNSINQLTREAPAFANSIQTGFMAISNNLPIFFDAISQTRAEIAKLRADGQQVPSLFKQLTSSLVSWGTALSVGVTLLTFFGDEIVDAIFNTKEKAKADEESKKALEAKQQAEERYISTIRNSASEEITRARLLFESAKNVNLTMEERKQKIEELRQRYPQYLKNLSDQQILAGNTANAETRLNDALVKRGIALALQDKIRESYGKLTDAIIEQQKAEESLTTVADRIAKSQDVRRKGIQDNAQALEQLNSRAKEEVELGKLIAQNRVRQSKESQAETTKEIQTLVDLYNKYAQFLDVVNEGGETRSKATDKVTQAETNSRVAFERSISTIEERLALMSKENVAYGFLETQLKLLKDAYEALYGEQKNNNDEAEKTIKFGTADYYTDRINKLRAEQSALANTTEEYKTYEGAIKANQEALDKLIGKEEEIEKLHDAVQEFLKGISSSTLNDFGFDSLTTLLDGTFNKLYEQADTAEEKFALMFNAITELAQDTFAFLHQNSQAYFDAQAQNLARERDIALQFAGESAAGREEIERQYEEKRRELRIKEAKAQKEQALFNVILNTAQGITAALASVPPNIPLSIAIGLIGAAQAAMISARPIPAFKDGVRDFEGGLAVVGDGGRSEVIQTPSGGLFKTPATDTLISMPKGSNVFKSEADFLRQSGSLLGGVPHIKLQSLTKGDMIEVMNGTIARMPVSNTTWDARGVKSWIGTTNARTAHVNNVVKIKGIRIG